MQNRFQLFVRRILQNSQLNREKFVINKKMYTKTISKNKAVRNNHMLIITPFYISNADFQQAA
jgi:hypothetical protein